ncbi:unnamed protein product [Phaedon cochleariae]|uniref:peptidylprolyl isomerase n=1 Tax=Phaedon cochleariae TaxID=80249 RepID=A0A9P0DDA3_PHACE|nr:unnamed protein product [Phaedon cochleariae]
MSEASMNNEEIGDYLNTNEKNMRKNIENIPNGRSKNSSVLTDSEAEEYENNKESTESSETPSELEKQEEWVDLLGSGALMKKIIIEGLPDSRPQRNETCRINYTCYLEDETVVDGANNFELNLGDSDVIQGLDVALGLMNLNEKCRLKIEPRFAFGKKGLPPKIPGDCTVIYDVELLYVGPEDTIEELTIQQRKIKGNKKRERGNWWYTRGENNIAIQCYRRALDYLDEVEGGITGPLSENEGKSEVTDADLQSLLEDRVSVCNNMAAAQIKMEMYDAALNSLQVVLRCQPNNVKAHFRKAKVYIGKNDLPLAMKFLQKAKELSPNDIEIQKEINGISKLLDKQKVTERELARRMFNGPKTADRTSVSKNKNGKSKVGIWATLGAVVVVGVAGIVAYRFKVV